MPVKKKSLQSEENSEIVELTIQLFKSIMTPILSEIVMDTIAKEQNRLYLCSDKNPNKYCVKPDFDIYGNKKQTESSYYECASCNRRIAASRFANHLERCLGGRNSRRKTNTSSRVDSDTSARNSPSESPAVNLMTPSSSMSSLSDDDSFRINKRNGSSGPSSRANGHSTRGRPANSRGSRPMQSSNLSHNSAIK